VRFKGFSRVVWDLADAVAQLEADDDDDDDDDDDAHWSGIGIPKTNAIALEVSYTHDDDEEFDIQHIELVDDDDDESEDDSDDGDDESENVAIIKEWANSSSQRKGGSSQKERQEKLSKSEIAAGQKQQQIGKSIFKDALRQNCITALRKLCDQGSISPKQKRVLLTDIISSSSKGDFSMVEVAYDLLCSDGATDGKDDDENENDTAEEEFAEQCRVFAQERLQKDEKDSY